MLSLLGQYCLSSSVLLGVVWIDALTAPLPSWVSAVLMNEARATYQNQSGLQLIRAVRARSALSPLSPSLAAQGYKGQE